MYNIWRNKKKKIERSWDKFIFNFRLNQETVKTHAAVIASAEYALSNCLLHESVTTCLSSSDPVVRQGWALKQQVEHDFRHLYAGKTAERILIHVPSPDFSPAGYSLFTNLAESLNFIGVPTLILGWDADTAAMLNDFNPTVLLTSDHQRYLARIDWVAIANYRKHRCLRVGLTASIAEYGNTPLQTRLVWAASHNVDFYYTFRDQAYVTTRMEYGPFLDAGYNFIYLPFGANILHYYPVGGIERDLNFVIMATRKSEHITYMKEIATRYPGFIDGPGWKHVSSFKFKRERDRYIYARAKVGLNVHLPEQIEWACEVNERTYQVAACGVPQLIDHPKLIDKLFPPDTIYVADTPIQYARIFQEILGQPELALKRALLAQREVFLRHTTFHRADDFLRQLAQISTTK